MPMPLELPPVDEVIMEIVESQEEDEIDWNSPVRYVDYFFTNDKS